MRPLGDYALTVRLLKKCFVKNVILSSSSENLRAVFEEHPKLVVAANHGPVFAPVYVSAAMIDLFLQNAAAERSFIAIVWNPLYDIPGFKSAARYASQLERSSTFEEILSKFQSDGVDDCYVMPEGENCCFGNSIDIQPFVSPRFLECAVRCEVPVLLGIHYGSDFASKTFALSQRALGLFKFFPQKTYVRAKETKMLVLPFWQGRLPEIRFSFKLYRPALSSAELSCDKVVRRRQLEEEGERVRAIMQEIVEQLKLERWGGAVQTG